MQMLRDRNERQKDIVDAVAANKQMPFGIT